MNHEVAKNLWDELKELFGLGNAVRLANLQDEIHACKQGDDSVSQYYTNIKGLWEEYTQFSPIVPCTCAPGNAALCLAVEAFKTKQENDYLIRFLRGLNENFDVVKTQLLMMRPLPSIITAYNDALQHEEKLKSGSGRGKESQAAAFAIPQAQRFDGAKIGSPTGDKKFCRYCKKDNHTIEDCPRLKNRRKLERSSYRPGPGGSFAGTASVGGEVESNLPTSTNPGILGTYTAGGTTFSNAEMNQLRTMLQVSSNGSSSAPSHHAFSVSQMQPQGTTYAGNYAMNSSLNKYDDNTWIVDTGASDHIAYSLFHFIESKPISDVFVYLPNASKVSATHVGTVRLSPKLLLHNVLCVPSFAFNLISVSKLTGGQNISLIFRSESCVIQDLSSTTTIGLASQTRGLYRLISSQLPSNSPVVAAGFNFQPQPIHLWHWRLGHPSHSRIQSFNFCNESFSKERVKHCETCHFAKHKRLPFTSSVHHATAAFQLVHVDIWGPLSVKSHDGFAYFLTVVDDYSRGVWLYLLKHKSEARGRLEEFCELVKTQFDTSVKVIRSDQGAEFHMVDYCAQHGIIHEMTCVATPEQNSRVERKHQDILNVARALKFQSGLSLFFWSDFVLHAVHLINRLPSTAIGHKTPYEMLHGVAPNLDYLRVFGCLCYASTLSHNRPKFNPRARQCVFLGFPVGIKGYKLYDIHSHHFVVSRDVTFHETIFPFLYAPSNPSTISSPEPAVSFFPPAGSVGGQPIQQPAPPFQPTIPEHTSPTPKPTSSPSQIQPTSSPSQIQLDSYSDDELTSSHDSEHENSAHENSADPIPRRSQRSRTLPTYLKDYHLNASLSTCPSKHHISQSISYKNLSPSYKVFALNIITQKEPDTYFEAVQEPCWVKAITEELSALQENQTWDLVSLPHGKKAVGNRWVFKIKHKPDGSVERYKARLVAKVSHRHMELIFLTLSLQWPR
ncbi:Retrovirus-related Pol polyprotein from transposon RE1 [Linum perenne]